jgi:nucleoside-diphosphate-sugar epimerase
MAADGWIVRGTFHQATPRDDLSRIVEWRRIQSLAEEINWEPLLRGVNCVVHAAAIAHRTSRAYEVSDFSYDQVNHRSTAQLAWAARRSEVGRFIFVSTIGAVTEMSDTVVNEETLCIPSTPYGRSKLAGERAVSEILADGDCDWCTLRPTLMYGPGNPGNMARLLRLIRLRIPIPFGRLRNRRSFLFVGNMASAVQLVATATAASRRVFCVADTEVLSTPDLIRAIGSATRRRIWMVAPQMAVLAGLGCVGDMVERVTGRSPGFDSVSVRKLAASLEVSTQRLRSECGWRPPFSLKEGVQKTFGADQIRENAR